MKLTYGFITETWKRSLTKKKYIDTATDRLIDNSTMEENCDREISITNKLKLPHWLGKGISNLDLSFNHCKQYNACL